MGNFQGYTLPGPTGGLNLVDPIDNMDPSDALELQNVFPGAQGARVRGGYDLVGGGQNGNVSTLTGIALSTGTSQVVFVSGLKIQKYVAGVVTDITGATAPTTSKWMTDTFGSRLYLASGQDTLQVYDGTTVADSTFSGVTLANLINVSSYKERLWFVEKDTLKAWYGNTLAVGGSALTSNDFQFAMRKGGHLLFAGSWTNETAATSAELFFACSSEGEIIFYQGSSPADVTTPWGIVARFYIGKPLGYRAFVRVNNDVWIITEQGIVPVSSLFSLDPAAALDTVGRKINPLISQYAALIGPDHMWHGVHYPIERMVIVVIPTSGSSSILAVYATDTRAWTTFLMTDPEVTQSVAVVDGALYYGGLAGNIYLGESGYTDDGSPILFSGRGAFSFFGSRGNYKAFKDIRPLMRTNRRFSLRLGIDTNFQRVTNLDSISPGSGTFTAWGSTWGSPWSDGILYVFDRHATKGQGHCGAIRFQGSITDAPLDLYGFEIRFEIGGQV